MWDLTRASLGEAHVPTLYRAGTSVEQWASAVLDENPSGDLFVVGNSVGGTCALEIARAAPGRVRGIVLIGTKIGVRADPAARDAAIAVLREQGVEGAWRRYWRPLLSPGCDGRIVSAARRIALEQDVEDLVTGVRAFHDRRDQTAFVRRWNGALVVVNGAGDRTPSPAVSAAGAPRAPRVVVDGAGHYVPLEQPGAVARLISERLPTAGR
jgi:pimeloyl-ACP methyl ester carboxylesterase